MLNHQKTIFVGVDTHKHEHTAVAINVFHQVLANVVFANDPQKFASVIQTLQRRCPENCTLVFGLEDTKGLGRSMAQWLVHRGFTVKEVNPVRTDRQRSMQTDPDKSDAKDAQAIAEVLYRYWDNLPQVRPDGRYKALRQAVRARQQLVKQITSLKNRLHALLHEQYPQYKEFFSDPFGKTALAFFSSFPSPAHLKHYGVKRLGAFLSKYAKNMGRRQAERILDHVDKSQSRDQATDFRDSLIPALIEQMQVLSKHVDLLNDEIVYLLKTSEYHLRTMSGVGDYLAAVFEAEIGPVERFASADKLARYAGIAPAERSSGSRKRTTSTPYGNRRLNEAFYLLALNQISPAGQRYRNPEARRYYEEKLNEGKSKKAAIRCLMRRLVDIIYAMMRDRSIYRLPEQEMPPTERVV